MSSMPEPTQTNHRINDKLSEIAADAMVALVAFNPTTPRQARDLLALWARRPEMTAADVSAVVNTLFPGYGDAYAEGFLDAIMARRQRDAEVAAGVEPIGSTAADRFACPEWCTFEHDDSEDLANFDLVTHMGDDHIDSVGRRLLDGHVEIQVARTDCRDEGTVGVPNLFVRCELELTTWEQAAELARSILDGFGYLKGADQP